MHNLLQVVNQKFVGLGPQVYGLATPLFQGSKNYSGPGNWTREIALCSQALYWLS